MTRLQESLHVEARLQAGLQPNIHINNFLAKCWYWFTTHSHCTLRVSVMNPVQCSTCWGQAAIAPQQQLHDVFGGCRPGTMGLLNAGASYQDGTRSG